MLHVDRRPTPDQLYLASKINGDVMGTYDADAKPHRITPAAIQRWNVMYGLERTTAVLREVWGSRPQISNPYAYVSAAFGHETREGT